MVPSHLHMKLQLGMRLTFMPAVIFDSCDREPRNRDKSFFHDSEAHMFE